MLRLNYKGATQFTRDVLHPQFPGRVVEAQPGSLDPWKAPLLYEDSRHVFFLTSEERHQSLMKFRGFGFAHPSGVAPGAATHHFAPLLAPHQSAPTHGYASSISMVKFDGAWIGPFGRVTSSADHHRRRR